MEGFVRFCRTLQFLGAMQGLLLGPITGRLVAECVPDRNFHFGFRARDQDTPDRVRVGRQPVVSVEVVPLGTQQRPYCHFR